MEILLQVFVAGAGVGSMYALFAIGFNLSYNISRTVNLAQGEFAMVAAFLTLSLLSVQVPFLAAMGIALAVVAAFGLLVYFLLLARLRTPWSSILVTIALGMAMQGFALLVWGKDALAFPGLSSVRVLRVGETVVQTQYLWIIGITVVVGLGLWYILRYTRFGKGSRATAANRDLALLLGLPVQQLEMLSFGLSALLGGLAGLLIAPIVYVSFGMGTLLALKGLAAAAVGNLGDYRGAVVAGLALGLVETAVGVFSPYLKDAVAFGLLFAYLVLKNRVQPGVLAPAAHGAAA